jgi:hypothetical protein
MLYLKRKNFLRSNILNLSPSNPYFYCELPSTSVASTPCSSTLQGPPIACPCPWLPVLGKQALDPRMINPVSAHSNSLFIEDHSVKPTVILG